MSAPRAKLRRSVSWLGMRADRRSRGFRALLTRGLTVFVYHDITDSPSEFQRLSGSFTRPEQLERQMRWVGERFEPIAPIDLPQLGGSGPAPENAALVTFDDAWAGAFRIGLEILVSLGIPALYFVNMATVHGFPDLAAVRRYERLRSAEGRSCLDRPIALSDAGAMLDRIAARYAEDPEFRTFQGATASARDLHETSRAGRRAWLASHLFHHWQSSMIAEELLQRSAHENLEALASYPNVLPALATPYGERIKWSSSRAGALGASVLFVATGGQNASSNASVLDRLELETGPSSPRDWWWSAHRRRLFGSLAS